MNLISLVIIGYLMATGILGDDFPFFKTHQAMITAGINFIVLNGITAVSVSMLLKILYASEKRYRLIAKNVADVIWTMNMQLEFTYISPSIKQLLGYTVDEMMNKSIDEVLAKESVEKANIIFGRKLKQIEENSERAWNSEILEVEHYCKDGSTISANIHASLLKGPNNKPEGILGITRNITERKRNEKEKIRNQMIIEENRKFALVGQIAGKMAHDFN
ncbi:MAG: PAS domain S-box protein, partial [Desulfobacteraceae bacterium]|nr:PAS domain S-box protein [Desulfobacteraceae bacterium]